MVSLWHTEAWQEESMKTLDALLLTDLNICAISYCITISKVFIFFEMEFLSLWNFVYLKTILRSENECEPFSTALLLGDLTYVWERPGTWKGEKREWQSGEPLCLIWTKEISLLLEVGRHLWFPIKATMLKAACQEITMPFPNSTYLF